MVKYKIKIIDYILIYAFAFYTFLPHSIHQKISPDWLLGFGFPHLIHVSIGIISGLILFNRGFFKELLNRIKKR